MFTMKIVCNIVIVDVDDYDDDVFRFAQMESIKMVRGLIIKEKL